MRFGSAPYRALAFALSSLLFACGDDVFVGTDDRDRDGIDASAGDCDDDDASIHPGATDQPYDGIDQDCDGTDLTDVDNDGLDALQVPGGTDCDDQDRAVHPGALEVCDGVDNDCDGEVDLEAVDPETFFVDEDGDGYGDPARPVEACEAGDRLVENDDDCDDSTAAAWPGGDETCDSYDNDCDGTIDDGVTTDFYPDQDGDGYGDPAHPTPACKMPAGHTTDASDCNDDAAADHPGAGETCDSRDNDCDEGIDEEVATLYYPDVDLDGYGDPARPTPLCSLEAGFVADASDCNDRNQDVHPGAAEQCNGRDDDCDTAIDEGLPGHTYYHDGDGDGHGDPDDTLELCSAAPAGYSSLGDDCDDGAATTYPGALELCNGIDDNCNTALDDGAGEVSYRDADGDGYGDPATTSVSCDSIQPGYVYDRSDCNDHDAEVRPGVTELPGDNIDQDCDGRETCYRDADSDGWRVDAVATVSSTDTDCKDAGEAFANAPTGDCDDVDPTIHPDAPELPGDEIDQDCDGRETCYRDADDDGYRPDGVTTTVSSDTDCADPGEAGAAEPTGDCLDSDAGVNPGEPERCDSLDNDCDDQIDDADSSVIGQKTWFRDKDLDGYGSPDSGTTASCGARPSGYSSYGTDCNDNDKSVNPGALEACNGVDDDCDGLTDDGDSPVSGQFTFYKDNDRDSYGAAASGTKKSCSSFPPSGYQANNLDCDDSNKNISPAAAEVCDAIDNDCDGKIDDADAPVTGQKTYYKDGDGDGYGASSPVVQTCAQVPPKGYAVSAADCNDANKDVNPAAQEICNGIDDDCDGHTDDADPSLLGQLTYYRDVDGDGYGSASSGAVRTCASTPPPGYSSIYPDCDDEDPEVNPGADEVCNGLDDDCDLEVDEAGELYFLDDDGDGFGDPEVSLEACVAPAHYVPDDTDCDDGAAEVNPAALEVPGNQIDDDCDGIIE